MYCTKCGTAIREDAAFCSGCGEAVNRAPSISPQSIVTPAPGSPPLEQAPPAPYTSPAQYAAPPQYAPPVQYALPVAPILPAPYAGFWLRFVAYILDGLLFAVVFGIFIAIAMGIHGPGYFRAMGESMAQGGNNGVAGLTILPMMFIGTIIVFVVAMSIASWLYYALMESSANQGTLGKIVMGLIVTDLQGRRISFGRASGRFFAKLITGIIPLAIGYIMAGFTEKKQALHDMIASCLVLKKV